MKKIVLVLLSVLAGCADSKLELSEDKLAKAVECKSALAKILSSENMSKIPEDSNKNRVLTYYEDIKDLYNDSEVLVKWSTLSPEAKEKDVYAQIDFQDSYISIVFDGCDNYIGEKSLENYSPNTEQAIKLAERRSRKRASTEELAQPFDAEKFRQDQQAKAKKEYQDAVLNDPNASASEIAIVAAEKMREMGYLKDKK